jgi:hypothetical protein
MLWNVLELRYFLVSLMVVDVYLKKEKIIVPTHCAKETGSPWTIYSFIVRLLEPYELPSSIVLGCLGLCPFGWSTYSLAVGRAGIFEMLLFGRLCLLAFCGACGGSRTTKLLRINKGRLKSSSPFSFFFSSFIGQLLI